MILIKITIFLKWLNDVLRSKLQAIREKPVLVFVKEKYHTMLTYYFRKPSCHKCRD